MLWFLIEFTTYLYRIMTSKVQKIQSWCLLTENIMSSSSSSSDDEILSKRPKDNFLKIIEQMDEIEFKTHFRMKRNTVNEILKLIENDISTCIIDRGGQSINSYKQLLIAIWYFATPDSYRSICSRFGIGRATGLRTVRRVCKAILKLSPTYIKWPTGEYAEDVINGFQRMGFPGTIGSIDGTYIPIPQPKDHGLAYICRKNFAAVILQAICDNKMVFTHCYAGEVGSKNDAAVLRNSEVWKYLTQIPEKFPHNSHLVGDKAYPCMPTLMTPFKEYGQLTREQTNYNYIHSCARTVIERAFALLKGRFRILKFMDVRSIGWIPRYIIACCILHNLCILQNDILELDNPICNVPDDDNIVHMMQDEQRRLGQQKRDQICQQLNIQE